MLRSRNLHYLQKRFKGGKQKKWVVEPRKKNIDKALNTFDDFYGSVFGLRWRSMRAALLTEHKYIAMVNNFGDSEKTCSLLEMDGAINIKSLVHVTKERDREMDQHYRNHYENANLRTRIDQIAMEKQETEIINIYQKAGVENNGIPKSLQYGENNTNEEDRKQVDCEIVDPYKTLEEALEEDCEIDYSRIVDPDGGDGALREYVPANRLKGMDDWIPESNYYKYYQTTRDFPLNFELETDFMFPEHLCLYTYEMSNCSEFKPPRKCLTGVLSHYLMDGASILPPIFLDVRNGDRVLDACAAPGGKSLLMLQTLHPGTLVCNDIQESRLKRIRKVMGEYLFDYDRLWEGKRLIMNQSNACNIEEYGSYDKILVDVPCTTDRHSLMENDNNIFKPSRVKERLRLPELQASILANCLRLLKPGGSLVYSTCSLSPIQNDGVVHMALQSVFSEHGITVTIKDLSLSIQYFSDIFKFEHPKGLKYGQMVVPYLPANFGPMYFSKIKRDN